jgi:ferredoxin
VKIAPEVFHLREDGPTEVANANPGPEFYDAILEAEGLCPTHAILVEQEGSKS